MLKILGLIFGLFVIFFVTLAGAAGLIIAKLLNAARVALGGESTQQKSARRQAVFLETVFVLMGKLAKADGRVSEAEVAHVEEFIRKMGMSSEHRREAIQQFKRGAAPDFDMSATLAQFQHHCAGRFNLSQTLLVYLIVMALADGNLKSVERGILEQIASQLGFNQNTFNHLLNMVLSQAQFSRQSSSGYYQHSGNAGTQTSASSLTEAYRALGVQASATNQEVKRAYRKLMSQYHPDKLMGQGVPEDMIAVATEQAKEIQLAYDLIKKHRGLK